jgi:hypothetical protein
MAGRTIQINRAPVLTLWATVVAERLGHDADEALTLGKALAGLNAQSKGRRLGIFDGGKGKTEKSGTREAEMRRNQSALLLGRSIPVVRTDNGVRATDKGKSIDPGSVRVYLEKRFGADLAAVRAAFERLAATHPPEELQVVGFKLYEKFRPAIPEGNRGWGAKGTLDLALVLSLAR